MNKGELVELDEDWVELIVEAKNMGMTLEDVKRFFESRINMGSKDSQHFTLD